MTAPLAPALGHLAGPPAARPWDDIRLALLDTLVRAHRGHGADAAAWRTAWASAAAALRDAVITDAADALTTAAMHSRYPARRLAALLPDAEQADILHQRLLAAAIPLERLEGAPPSEQVTRSRGAAAEAAWEAATRIAREEQARWHGTAARVAAWRRPWRPFIIGALAVLLPTALVSLWLGGQLDAPGWFTPVATWFWGLPWP